MGVAEATEDEEGAATATLDLAPGAPHGEPPPRPATQERRGKDRKTRPPPLLHPREGPGQTLETLGRAQAEELERDLEEEEEEV